MTQVSSIRIRRFHIFNNTEEHRHSFNTVLQDLRKGDQFRADDDSPFALWEAASDPYLNGDDVWVIEANIIAG